MANIKSAIKRNRQNEKRALANKSARSQLRTYTKKALAASGTEQSESSLREAIKQIDKAAGKGIIHKNAAARRKSRLTKRVRATVTATE